MEPHGMQEWFPVFPQDFSLRGEGTGAGQLVQKAVFSFFGQRLLCRFGRQQIAHGGWM